MAFPYGVYPVQVANALKSLTVTPNAAVVGASIAVNGVAVVSGSKSRALNLKVGPNTITIIDTAQVSAPTKTYIIVVKRA